MKKIEIQIRNLRLQRGCKLDVVAKLVGKSPSTISRLENSLSKIDIEMIRKLCEIYDAELFCVIIPFGESLQIPDEYLKEIIKKVCICHGCNNNRK